MCKAKEFTRCNPVGCKLYTIDELSTIVDLQQQLDQLKADREEALKQLEFVRTLNTVKEAENRKLSKTLAEIKEIAENREIFCENCGGGVESFTCDDCGYVKILQKISEVVG